jgi:hypothetical protein
MISSFSDAGYLIHSPLSLRPMARHGSFAPIPDHAFFEQAQLTVTQMQFLFCAPDTKVRAAQCSIRKVRKNA